MMYRAQQHEPIVAERKSVGLALVLVLYFGPFGMLYSTALGAITMLAAMAVAMFYFENMFFYAVAWLIGMIWACVAASWSGANTVQPRPECTDAEESSAAR
ncbi:MAG: hypothetical protein KF859_02700 [Phycisphaeraceae bacterium]|nr:hypothetical protein [Phycisphaeraceae bacterium]